MDKRLVVGGIVVLVAAIVGAALYFDAPANSLLPGEQVATSTPNEGSNSTPASTSTSTPQKPKEDLTKYPEHNIPAGATVVDDYFYLYNGSVYLNSIKSPASSAIPNAGASSFKRLTNYRSVSDPTIALNCGRAGEYAFYSTSRFLYIYQIWLTPTFRHGEIRVIVGADPESFAVVSPSSFQTDLGLHTISYEVGTSTCQYVVYLG